ncbi:glutathione synthetase ATP-binding domain-like protein [Colletotrichum somersetense]|nr:glutathione synthetase ATP-binding domain-like protein [Colletotrichum somersetense]
MDTAPLQTDGLTGSRLDDLLSTTVSVVIIDGSHQDHTRAKLALVVKELLHCLNVPLTTHVALAPKRVCVVGGGFCPEFRQDLVRAAEACAIKLVVIDKPGHWAESSQGCCEAFLPVDMSTDDELDCRIAAACEASGLNFDGITSFSDSYHVSTVKAALQLGLTANPPSAYDTCTDKTKFRERFPIAGYQSFSIESMDDFRHKKEELAVQLPVITKPRNGGNSAGVSKAESLAEAETLVKSLLRSGPVVLVEKYIDGPEVDVDVVLVDGEVVFHDISDMVPCSAESESGAHSQAPVSFLETEVMWPSRLPATEQKLLLDNAKDALAKLGFKNGVFHIEARVNNSSMCWTWPKTSDSQGESQPSLEPRAVNGEDDAVNPVLIEINPRCIGYPGQPSISSCYGIDCALIQLLLCIPDVDRARHLSQQYASSQDTSVVTQCIIAPRGGVFYGEKMFSDLMARRRDLADSLVASLCFFKDGATVRVPSERASWIAFWTVRSNEGRTKAMRISDEIKHELTYEIR